MNSAISFRNVKPFVELKTQKCLNCIHCFDILLALSFTFTLEIAHLENV